MVVRIQIGLALLALGAGAQASTTERRCGWLDNPTPQNWSLVDRSGEWTLAEQGGYVADGFDALPDLGRPRAGWKVTNTGDYGYGCACVEAGWNRRTMRAMRLFGWVRLPLARCRGDKLLARR